MNLVNGSVQLSLSKEDSGKVIVCLPEDTDINPKLLILFLCDRDMEWPIQTPLPLPYIPPWHTYVTS